MKQNYFCFRDIVVLFFYLLSVSKTQAQSTPAAQLLQYNQTFALLAHGSAIYPAGLQGWVIGTTSTVAFRTTAPTGNSNLIINSNASNANGGVHNYNGKIGILSSALLDPALCVAINTIGLNNIQVRFDAMTIRNPYDGILNTMINGLELQYRTGNISSTWTTVTGNANGFYQNNTTLQTGAVVTPQNQISQIINLPAACNNQSAVFLRWVVRDISGIGSRASFAIDNVVICPFGTPTISITGPGATCGGQSLNYFATTTFGGITPFFQWKKNGVTNVGTNSPSLEISGLVAGDNVSCVLTSNAGCVTTTTATSNTINIASSTAPVISSIVKNSCTGMKNGSIDLSISGGTAPYSVNWDTTNKILGPNFVVTVSTKHASHPVPGGIGLAYYIDGIEGKELFITKGISYTFDVTMGGGHPFHISTDVIGGNSSFIVTTGQTGAPTGNGFVTFKPNNFHTTPLYYPCALHQAMGWRINLQNGFNSEDLSNLGPGIYSVIVTDANGCTATSQFTITNVGNAVSLSATVTDATCFSSNDGTIDLDISGGVLPHTTCWDTLNSEFGQQFAVTFGPKSSAHPFFGHGSSQGYIVNGEEGKEISLTRGIPYFFNVMTTNHPFRITTDSVGGTINNVVTSGQSGAPTQLGTVSFIPNNTHPSLLYYSCEFHQLMGYEINISDGYCIEDPQNLKPGIYAVYYKDNSGCELSKEFTVNQTPLAFDICDNGLDDNCNFQIDEGCSLTLNLKMFLEGFYTGNGFMNNYGSGGCLYLFGASLDSTDADSVIISVMDEVTKDLIESKSGILKTDGSISITFSSSVVDGQSYYIKVNHRNSVEVWSGAPVLFSLKTNYDFTIGQSQAFGNNMTDVGMLFSEPSMWAFFSGDIVDAGYALGGITFIQDGIIESLDYSEMENAASVTVVGYVNQDITGDLVTESADYSLMENNAYFTIFVIAP